MKLETSSGSITFTIESSKTLTVYSNEISSIKINGTAYSISTGGVTEISLSSGEYTITKGSGSAIIYAIEII